MSARHDDSRDDWRADWRDDWRDALTPALLCVLAGAVAFVAVLAVAGLLP